MLGEEWDYLNTKAIGVMEGWSSVTEGVMAAMKEWMKAFLVFL